MGPLGELNPSDLGSIKKPSLPAGQSGAAALASSRASQSAKKAAAAGMMGLDDVGGSVAGLPPRPKKRKPLGMHR